MNRKAYVQIGLAKDEGFLPDGREALIRGALANGDVCIELPEEYVDLVWDTAVEADVKPQETGPNESTIFVSFTITHTEEGTAFTSPIGFDDKPFLSALLEMVQTKVLLHALMEYGMMESQEVPYSFELHHKWTAIGVVAAEMAIGGLEDSTGEEQFGINIAQIFSARDIKHRLPLLVAMQDHSFLDSLESLKQLFEGITRQRMSGTVDEAALLNALGATAEKQLAGENPFEDNADGAVQNMTWLAKITKKQAKIWRREGIIKGSPKRGFKITEDGRSYLEWMRKESPSMQLTEEMFVRQCNKVLRPSIQRSDTRRKKKATATNPQNVKDIQTFFESLADTAGVETDVIERFAAACGFKVTDGVATSTKRLSAEFAPRTGEVLVQVRGLEDLLAFSQEGEVDTLNPDVLRHREDKNLILWLRIAREDIESKGNRASPSIENIEDAFNAGVLYRQGILAFYEKYDLPESSLIMSWDDWEDDCREVFEIEEINAFSKGFLFGRSYAFELREDWVDAMESILAMNRMKNALILFRLFRTTEVMTRILACVTSLCRPKMDKQTRVSGYYFPREATILYEGLRNLSINGYGSELQSRYEFSLAEMKCGTWPNMYTGKKNGILEDWDDSWLRGLLETASDLYGPPDLDNLSVPEILRNHPETVRNNPECLTEEQREIVFEVARMGKEHGWDAGKSAVHKIASDMAASDMAAAPTPVVEQEHAPHETALDHSALITRLHEAWGIP